MSTETLSEGIEALLSVFDPYKDLPETATIQIGADGVLRIVLALTLLRKQARLLERELAIHRQDENSRAQIGELEKSATAALQELTADAARASVAGVSTAERQTIVTNYVTQSSPSYRLLKGNAITVTTAPYPGDPTRYSVTLRTDISSLPLQTTTGFFPMPSGVIQRTAVVRIGGY